MAIGQRVLEGRDRKSAIRRNKSTTPNGAADHAGRDDLGVVAPRGFDGEGRSRPIEKAIYLKASGMRPRAIRDRLGLNFQQLWNAQKQACSDIWEKISQLSQLGG